jgi:hypothetical protein
MSGEVVTVVENQNHITHCSIAILAIVMFLSSSIESYSQSPNPSTRDNSRKDKTEIIACRFYVRMVRVKVRDREGKEVSELTKDDFIVYEDGMEQPIVKWTREDGNSDKEGIQPGYEMAYYSLKYPFDGRYRKIHVEVVQRRKGKVRVEYRPKGYYAKKELLP